MRKLFAILLLLVSPSLVFGDNVQVVATADGDIVLAAVEDKVPIIKAIAVLATSTTSVEYGLYNEDNWLLGNGTTKLTVDLDGIDGPAGFIMPYNDHGWFTPDTANEDVKIYLSSSTPVIVVLVYTYVLKR